MVLVLSSLDSTCEFSYRHTNAPGFHHALFSPLVIKFSFLFCMLKIQFMCFSKLFNHFFFLVFLCKPSALGTVFLSVQLSNRFLKTPIPSFIQDGCLTVCHARFQLKRCYKVVGGWCKQTSSLLFHK